MVAEHIRRRRLRDLIRSTTTVPVGFPGHQDIADDSDPLNDFSVRSNRPTRRWAITGDLSSREPKGPSPCDGAERIPGSQGRPSTLSLPRQTQPGEPGKASRQRTTITQTLGRTQPAHRITP